MDLVVSNERYLKRHAVYRYDLVYEPIKPKISKKLIN